MDFYFRRLHRATGSLNKEVVRFHHGFASLVKSIYSF